MLTNKERQCTNHYLFIYGVLFSAAGVMTIDGIAKRADSSTSWDWKSSPFHSAE